MKYFRLKKYVYILILFVSLFTQTNLNILYLYLLIDISDIFCDLPSGCFYIYLLFIYIVSIEAVSCVCSDTMWQLLRRQKPGITEK